MLSWTDMQTQAQDMAFDYSAATLTFLQRNINLGLHILETELGSFYLEETRRGMTGATLNPPAVAPVITPVGTSGATSYGYKITALTNSGETTGSTEGTTSTGNASLSTTNYNQITFQPVLGATAYNVYRTTGGATQGYIGQVQAGYNTFFDTGITATSTTVPTSNTTYNNIIQLPENCIRIKTFYVTIGNVQYAVDEIFDEEVWRRIEAFTQNSKSNFAQKMFRRRNTLEIFPNFSSAMQYTMIYEVESKDLSKGDYTTGTISTIQNGQVTVTGASTSWDSSLIGKYFQLAQAGVAGTDQQWYLIADVNSSTQLTLATPYQGYVNQNGASLSYRIGEMARVPGPTHHIPVYFALWQYFQGFKKNLQMAGVYEKQYNSYMTWAKATYGKRYSTAVVPSQRELLKRVSLINPNWFPSNMT